MDIKSIKSMNQFLFQKLTEWLDSLNNFELNNLEYDRFARFSNIKESDACEYFKFLNKNKVIILKQITECPNCFCEINIDYNTREYECEECESILDIQKLRRNSTFSYKINKEFFRKISSEKRVSPFDIDDKIIDIGKIKSIRDDDIYSKENKKKDINVFFSYSHKDENMRNELEKHLKMLKRQGIISTWHDRKIIPGSEFDLQIDKKLKEANIILLLVSVDFLDSDYCYDIEVEQAIKMHESDEAVVIPVILRPCDWSGTKFAKITALPKDAKCVSEWNDKDAAFLNIELGIKKVANELKIKMK
ncbi:TPA: toll/interleukin-1 receptor domain-containing protein [Clostridium perfringens]